ncbi:serine/threonine-protein kinase [Salinispira pacifica]|uniref:Protein kinase domain-containing protein n=1 Tax=Salinispira pacifica TaxID=1307761 RepID=V5WGT4_9SPIO|nr:protein kinase [Salinispira pacifica]AHC14381.1 hypothetical protein L21SP2_0961 [Salinispira pacifica]
MELNASSFQQSALTRNYRIEDEIKADSVAVTLRARPTDPGDGQGREVHIHLLHSHLEQDQVIVNSFLQEYRIFSQFDHPGIPKVMSLHQSPPAVVVEAGDWMPLSSAPPRDFASVLAYCRSLAGILEYAHSQGYVFRDLNPGNAAVRPDGTAVIPDGARGRVKDMLGLSSTTMISSAAEYLAPEVLYGDNCDPRSDLYSLGMIIKTLIAGEPGIPVPRWFADLTESLCGEITKRPRDAAGVLELMVAQSVPEPAPEIPCAYCLKDYPAELPLCPHCGRLPPQISRHEHPSEGEILVLKQLSEKEEVIAPFIRQLTALSGDPDFTPNILTGDIRMYSKEEQKKGIRLPAVITAGLTSRGVRQLIELLERRKRSELHLVRYPAAKRRRFKYGPILPEQLHPPPSPGMIQEAEKMLTMGTTPSPAAVESGPGELHMCILRILGNAAPEDWDSPTVRSKLDRIHHINEEIMKIDRILGEMNLGDLYTRIHSLNRRIARETDTREASRLIDEKTHLVESFRRFRQAEMQKTQLRREAARCQLEGNS